MYGMVSSFYNMKSDQNQYWSMTEGVFNCLIDDVRTRAFRKAIQKTVKKGDVVVDLGSGSGVLAMFAADAGASKVFSVEIDKRNIVTLRSTFFNNGFSTRIVVVEGDATKIRLPEPVDVIIGEMVATGLVEELQIPAMNNALKYSKKNVRVLLSKINNYADVVFNNSVFYSHKFDIFRYEYPDLKKLKSIPFSTKVKYATVDFSKVNKNNKINEKRVIKINKNGKINAVRISSETVFDDGSTLGATFAYCYPIILPVSEIKVHKDDKFEMCLSYEMCGGFKTLSYSLKAIL